MSISPDDRSKRAEKNAGGSLDEGLSSQGSIDKGYEPRTSGQGQRPDPTKREKVGKFTIC